MGNVDNLGSVPAISVRASSIGRLGTSCDFRVSLAEATKSSRVMPSSNFNTVLFCISGVSVKFEAHPRQQIGDSVEVE